MPAKLTQKEKARRAFAVAVKKVERARGAAFLAWIAMRHAQVQVESVQFCSDAERIGVFLKNEMEVLTTKAKEQNHASYSLQAQSNNLAEMLGLKERT